MLEYIPVDRCRRHAFLTGGYSAYLLLTSCFKFYHRVNLSFRFYYCYAFIVDVVIVIVIVIVNVYYIPVFSLLCCFGELFVPIV